MNFARGWHNGVIAPLRRMSVFWRENQKARPPQGGAGNGATGVNPWKGQ